MLVKLFKNNTSWAVRLNKAVLEMLGINEHVEMTIENDCIIIRKPTDKEMKNGDVKNINKGDE